ncbi:MULTISPECIES: hypothetical protein [unclassified Moraxella]|uniref:hypothetical protein n=1 Tax=unclassified Moraxella TaxID=2685852 RepID=UPI003AF77B99
MSGFAFSHQFSQRWLTTPAPVKATIIQELQDIHTLLQPDTKLEDFHFNVDNLSVSIEQLLAIEQIRERQERLEREKLERERLEEEQAQARLETERLEAERQEQERLEQQKLEQQQQEQQREQAKLKAERAEQQRLEQQRLEQERLEQDRVAIEALEQERAIAKQKSLSATTQVPAVVPVDMEQLSQKIREPLQAHIDTYLAEIKADLYQWLEMEVTKQVTEHLNAKV